MNKEALKRAYEDAKKEVIETTAEGRSFLRSRYQFWEKRLEVKQHDRTTCRTFSTRNNNIHR